MESKVEFAAQTIKLLVSLIIQLVTICEEEDIDLSKEVHPFDMKNNEWHIAAMQIYENLLQEDCRIKNERGELRFDEQGHLIEPAAGHAFENFPTISAALRPLLQFVDVYRRRCAAPENTLVR